MKTWLLDLALYLLARARCLCIAFLAGAVLGVLCMGPIAFHYGRMLERPIVEEEAKRCDFKGWT